MALADALKSAGYATGLFGKWHLGGPEFYPECHGFDLNIAGTDQPQPRPGYFAPYEISTIEQGSPGEYITDRLGQEAVNRECMLAVLGEPVQGLFRWSDILLSGQSIRVSIAAAAVVGPADPGAVL